MTKVSDQTRRRLLLRGRFSDEPNVEETVLYIASAVIMAWPKNREDVIRRIMTIPETEIHHVEGSRIIVVMEATESGAIGARLAEIALMEGVLAANLVFEQTDNADPGEAS